MHRAARSLLLILFALVPQAWAQGQGRAEPTEAAVKAAYLYKFATYVEWPAASFPRPDTPFVIAVLGADEVAAELERIVPGRTIHGRSAQVRRLREGEPLAGVHVLFVGKGQPNLRPILRAAQQPGVLLVTESENGLDMGSAINFVVADERVGFEVSVDGAQRNGLKISSRMLNVARRVVSR